MEEEQNQPGQETKRRRKGLSQEQIDQIKTLADQGKNMTEIATEIGIHRMTVKHHFSKYMATKNPELQGLDVPLSDEITDPKLKQQQEQIHQKFENIKQDLIKTLEQTEATLAPILLKASQETDERKRLKKENNRLKDKIRKTFTDWNNIINQPK